MSPDNVHADVLIVGAGLAGLMAAHELEGKGFKVSIFDKGRSPGGRMATRRIGPGMADHGVQFFTARTPEFQAYIDEWIGHGIVFEWSKGFSEGSLQLEKHDGHSRYAVRGGMNALAKHLALGLRDLRTNVRIRTATCDAEGWVLQDEEGMLYSGQALILTPPVPQALEILDEGATVLVREEYNQLAAIEYFPCLTGMFWIEGGVIVPEPGAVQRINANITWIADNQRKGISSQATIVTIQASPGYSTQLWSAADDRILNALAATVEMFMAQGSQIREAQLKRWRYSGPVDPLDIGAFVADNEPPLVFAGDAFGGARVEGACLSGLAAAQKLIELAR